MNSDLVKRLLAVEERNKRVEEDKAWETSIIRRGLIAIITFIFIGLYLSWLDVNKPWLNAIVPVVGFLFSTLAVQRAKNAWLNKRK